MKLFATMDTSWRLEPGFKLKKKTSAMATFQTPEGRRPRRPKSPQQAEEPGPRFSPMGPSVKVPTSDAKANNHREASINLEEMHGSRCLFLVNTCTLCFRYPCFVLPIQRLKMYNYTESVYTMLHYCTYK